jgi:hypothetical protein
VPFLDKCIYILLVPQKAKNKTKQSKAKQYKTKQALTMGSSEKVTAATTVQESIADLAPGASENKVRPTFVFPTTSTHEDLFVIEEEEEKNYTTEDADYSNASSSNQYHEFYLQREGMEFSLPILFEDGMDFEECECYYASIQQQSAKQRSILQQIRSPSSFKRALQQETQPGKLSSCSILRSGDNKRLPSAPSNEKDPKEVYRLMRQYSFSSMPQLSQEMPTLTRSQSCQDLSDVSHHVRFEQHVQIVTIYEAIDYPEDVRRNLWMSREEMSNNMRRAMRRQQRQERSQRPPLSPRRPIEDEKNSKQSEPEQELKAKQEKEALRVRSLSFHTTCF